MARYHVNHNYASGSGSAINRTKSSIESETERLGPWAAGDVVELNEALAAWVNHDSPGCLTPAPDGATVTATQQQIAPDRRDRIGDRGDQGPITPADFKAVK